MPRVARLATNVRGRTQHHAVKCGVDAPPAWREADVGKHFLQNESSGGWECRHCSAVVRGGSGKQKEHMATCQRLPESARRALDESEVARAAAGAGVYGSNPVFRGFEVTGWLVARCKSCLKTVRGCSGNLTRHSGRCSGLHTALQHRPTKRAAKRPRSTTTLTSDGANSRSLELAAAHGTSQRQLRASGGVGLPARTASLRAADRVVGSASAGSGDDCVGVDHAAHRGTVATRRWAVGVRAVGGPEAVAAALRARYPRLYASRGV